MISYELFDWLVYSHPVSSDNVEYESIHSTNSSFDSEVKSDHVAVFDGPDVDDGSDVHEEVRAFKAERRSYKRRSRRETIPPNLDDVPLGEDEYDIGFDETEPHNRCLEGKVGGDEPDYYSFEAYSCEIDDDDGKYGVTLAPRRELVENLLATVVENATRNRGAGPSTAASTTTTTTVPSTTASTTGQVVGLSTVVRLNGRSRKEIVVVEAPLRSRGRPRKESSAPKDHPRP
ncbi:hypothetical protein K7X08_035569 [Anisodus acutangulus]|uniref:Uncharacterized protein n=1 Tax=Anisodus acutangulus TaxID=402998 RepID=A0A9Q1R2Q3_9SOLA|nr:hypothetical protein K7X08_035569 [Anisodus acutangulus]